MIGNCKWISGTSLLSVMVVFISTLTSCATRGPASPSLNYSSALFNEQEFVPHEGKGPMQSYLAMNISFAPTAELRQRLETELASELKYRPEAHITVVTPVEFDQILSKKITMREINALAVKFPIQKAHFKPICIGHGSLDIKGQVEDTYYVVVSSDELFRLRSEIQKLFVSKGGAASAFQADLFYPHITIGFTQRDLHYEDGVIKDERSCLYRLHE